MGIRRLRCALVDVRNDDCLLSTRRPAGQSSVRRTLGFRYVVDRVLARDDQCFHGDGTHAGRWRAAADGKLWRLRSGVDDVRRRRYHQCQYATLCFLKMAWRGRKVVERWCRSSAPPL